MEYRRLGNSGLKVSALSLGSWVTFGRQVFFDDAVALMSMAYDAGVNFFDNAEGYEAGLSETIMGEALARLGWRRDSYCVSSKVFSGCVPHPTVLQRGLSRKHIMDACHQALKRLQVEYLDLYFCHRPDKDVPMEEIVTTMHTLVMQGKILYWGTSEWPAVDIMQAYGIAKALHITPPTMEQSEYNMFARTRIEKEYARLYSDAGIGTTVFCPLNSGVLTGKYNEGIPADSRIGMAGFEWLKDMLVSDEGKSRIEKVKKLSVIAHDLGISMTSLALAWLLKNPHVSTIILGASKMVQLEENLKSVAAVPLLNESIMKDIETILQNL